MSKSNVDVKVKCCVNCVYYNTGWCELKGITPYPPDKTDCENFKPIEDKELKDE